MTRLRKIRAGFVWVAVGLMAVPAQGFGAGLPLPSLALEVPNVPSIEVPALPAPKAPTIEVPTVSTPKTPLPPVKVPTVPVPVPTLPAPKLPSVKVPTAPSIKAPSVKVSAPTAPAVKVPAPPAPSIPGTPRGSAPPAGTSAPSSATSPRSSSSGPTSSSSAAAAPGSAGPSPGLSGYGYAGAPGQPAAGVLGARVTRARAHDASLKATVEQLKQCLSYLPAALQLALELRTGVDAPPATSPARKALSPARAATYLHLSTARFSRLEKRALRLLRLADATHACDVTTEASSSGLVVFSSFESPGGIVPPGTGGVDAARYASTPLSAASGLTVPEAGPSESPLARAASTGLLWLGSILAVLGIALVVADGLGLGPRYRWGPHEWARRLLHWRP